jgi:putative ABC transport system permease protein
MWQNYLTIGFRALRRDPLFTAINLAGLAVGLAGCLLIILFIRYQLSFDEWLPDAERTYQVQRIETTGADVGHRFAITSFVAATAMPSQFPEIEKASGLLPGNGKYRKGGDVIEVEDVYASDANFLEVMRLPLVVGDPETALDAVDNVVLTESTARRLFGRTDVLGETVSRVTSEGDMPMRVTGVLKDLPANSHLRLGALYRPTSSPATRSTTSTPRGIGCRATSMRASARGRTWPRSTVACRLPCSASFPPTSATDQPPTVSASSRS